MKDKYIRRKYIQPGNSEMDPLSKLKNGITDSNEKV